MSTALTYSTFAIAGATGNLGPFIAKELVRRGATVIILSRTQRTDIPAGTTVRTIDYDSESSSAKALEGVEVVISTLSDEAVGSQALLATASKKAGVKLFVPADFGCPAELLPEDHLFFFKRAIHLQLRDLGLPYTIFNTGYFSDYIFIPPVGIDIAAKKFAVIGAGDKPVSFTTREDIATFVGYTLTQLPRERLENATLNVEGEKTSMISIVSVFEKVFGGKFEVEHRDVKELERKVEKEGFGAALDAIRLMEEYGYLDVGENHNSLVPNWAPLKVEEAVRKYFA